MFIMHILQFDNFMKLCSKVMSQYFWKNKITFAVGHDDGMMFGTFTEM